MTDTHDNGREEQCQHQWVATDLAAHEYVCLDVRCLKCQTQPINELETARAQAGLAQRYREHLRLAVEAGVDGPLIDDIAWEEWLKEADALTAGPTAEKPSETSWETYQRWRAEVIARINAAGPTAAAE